MLILSQTKSESLTKSQRSNQCSGSPRSCLDYSMLTMSLLQPEEGTRRKRVGGLERGAESLGFAPILLNEGLLKDVQTLADASADRFLSKMF